MSFALLIDDAYSNNNMLRLYLQRLGVDSVSVLTGKRGYEIAQIIMPDIILLDLMMPVKSWDGYQTAHAIKTDPKLTHIPVIAVSSHHDESDAQRAQIDDFLKRPFGAAELKALLEKHLSPAQQS